MNARFDCVGVHFLEFMNPAFRNILINLIRICLNSGRLQGEAIEADFGLADESTID